MFRKYFEIIYIIFWNLYWSLILQCENIFYGRIPLIVFETGVVSHDIEFKVLFIPKFHSLKNYMKI